MSDTKTKEPLIRIIKRDRSSFGYKVWVRAAAIILALVVDAIFIYSVTGLNPLSVYGVMLNGTFMTSIRFSWAMRDLVTLLCIGIALAPAFKMRFWNIGAEGQVLAGADVSENGTVFQYENRRQKGAVYNVYAGEDIISAYGAKIYSKGDLVKENFFW